jgi:hypothetical protein
VAVLNINFDSAVLAHLSGAGPDDVINISISLGEKAIEPAPKMRFTGPLAELMEAELLKPGDKLAFHQRRARRTGRATVLGDGRLAVNGNSEAFWSPSKAAQAVTGNVINGWTLWRKDDGEGLTLDELRQRLERGAE